MADMVFEVSSWETVNIIKGRLNPMSYIECGRCGTLKVDALEILLALEALWDEFYAIEDDEVTIEDEIRNEVWGDMLHLMVKGDPWLEFGADMIELDLDWSEFYLVHSHVLLMGSNSCDCFAAARCTDDWYFIELEELDTMVEDLWPGLLISYPWSITSTICS